MPNHDRTTGVAALEGARVAEIMSAPLVTCSPDLPLIEVAELMARHRIHALVVLAEREPIAGERWGVLSEIDLVAAAPFDERGVTAGRIAGTPPVMIDPTESVARAASLMGEYGVTHLVVVDDAGEAVGVVSALDIAEALAGGDETPPLAPPAAPAEDAGPLRARPGDRLVIRGHFLGEPTRDAEILEAHGAGGGPPFLVRWEDNGRESLYYPGSDAFVESTARSS
jgi:CBS domain-containing protein